MVPVEVCNLALSEIGSRIFLTALTDNSPQGRVANLNYTPRVKMLIRAANWDFTRGQAILSVWKEAITNGVASGNPPPQPWLFSYLYPTDCIKARFVLPTMPVAAAGTPLTTAPGQVAWLPPAPTGIPFVVATDRDNSGNPLRVLLCNLPNAQLIYTRDLSGQPDEWDPMFLNAATAFLGCYFINALERNAKGYEDQVAQTKSILDMARVANGTEGITSVDHTPDWLRARMAGSSAWGWNGSAGLAGGWGVGGGWDACQFPCGLSY